MNEAARNPFWIRSVLCIPILLILIPLGCTDRNTDDDLFDLTFGTTGRVQTDFSSNNDDAFALVIQGDGKILVAGSSRSTTTDFALAKYNTDGTLDTTFGTDGKVVTDFDSGDDVILDMVQQTDGKILVAGYSETNTSPAVRSFAVARYESDGSLDTTFDTDGKATFSIGVTPSEGHAVALQSDGKILVAGFGKPGTNLDFALIRLLTTGALDTTFDTDGIVTLDFSGFDDRARAVLVQQDGKIVVSGYAVVGESADFAVARFSVSGALDTSFGTNGTVVANITSFPSPASDPLTPNSDSADFLMDMLENSFRKIILGGYFTDASTNRAAILQLTEDGALDTTINSTGLVFRSISDGTPTLTTMTLDSNNFPVLAGNLTNTNGTDLLALGFNSSGATDNSFGVFGQILADVNSSVDTIEDIAFQGDGKLVMVGSIKTGATRDFLVTRFIP